MQPWLPHGQRRAVALDDHVADLAGGAAAVPAACRRGSARRRRRSPRRRRGPSRGPCPAPSSYSAVGRDADVVADRDPRPERLRRGSAPSGKLSVQAGRFLAFETAPVAMSTSPGEPTPTPRSADGSTPRLRPPRGSPPPLRRRPPRDRLRAASGFATGRSPRCRRRRRSPGSSFRRGRSRRAGGHPSPGHPSPLVLEVRSSTRAGAPSVPISRIGRQISS